MTFVKQKNEQISQILDFFYFLATIKKSFNFEKMQSFLYCRYLSMKTPEQLQQQTNQVKSSLDQLRNEAQSAEKTRKAVEIQSQLSSLQSEVEAARAAETDANKKQQIEEVKKLVEATSAEANNLVSNVAPATSTNKAQSAPEEGL